MVEDRGGDVGPELTSIAGTRTAQFIVESILQPSIEIASGYESILVQMNDGRILDGVLRRETTDSLWLGTSEGDVVALALGEVARRREQEVSLMPGNFAEILTVDQLHDLLAYLRTLR
jgi:putative heme-binding domain-containing protein